MKTMNTLLSIVVRAEGTVKAAAGEMTSFSYDVVTAPALKIDQ